MSSKVYLAWQDQQSRQWHTIGCLSKIESGYEFVFTNGVKKLKHAPKDLFRMEPGKRYRSEFLMPVFKNRLLNPSRSDFNKIAGWIGLSGEEDEFERLKKFGRISGVDAFMIYSEPEIEDGKYNVEFLVHGMRHLPENIKERCGNLKEGDELSLMLDVQNPADPYAIALREKDWNLIIGYAPAFYANDIYRILRNKLLAETATVKILKNNLNAPIQLRLLCKYSSEAEPMFSPFQTEEHKPYIERLTQ